MKLATLKTILLDGDGVIWRANEVVPGAQDFFKLLEQHGLAWALLTNNNTRTVADYVGKLQGFGIEADASRIFTSTTVTADYLLQRYGFGAPVHVVGMDGLMVTLAEAGFRLSCGEALPDHPVVAVVAGMDRAITHDKIKVAMRLILNGAEYVATNMDPNFPTPDGLHPGTGMVTSALQTVTGIRPVVMGKPERPIYDAALKRFGAEATTTAMVGDQLITDILGAQRLGIGTVAVLTGVVTPEALAESQIRPDYVFDSIAEFAKALQVA